VIVLTAFEIVTFLFSDNSAVVPPDSIPNSEVKRSSADGSVTYVAEKPM